MTEENNTQYLELLARPPVVKAFQWDGTLEGASALKSFIVEQAGNDRMAGAIMFEARFERDEPVIFIEFPKGYINREYSEKMRPDDWLVMGPGIREILHTEVLDRKYIRKETDV